MYTKGKSVQNNESSQWKIVMIKTIDDKEPIYYRLANMSNFNVIDIPAYKIFEEIINNNWKILNAICRENKIIIIDNDGYESTESIVVFDEFQTEIPSIFDWALAHNEKGTLMLNMFDSNRNEFSPSDYKVTSSEKLYWTCENRHTIQCGFSTFLGIGFKCPICKVEEANKTLSLFSWAKITNNNDILEQYETADNEIKSVEISWKSKKRVKFKKEDEEKQQSLYSVTVNNRYPVFGV